MPPEAARTVAGASRAKRVTTGAAMRDEESTPAGFAEPSPVPVPLPGYTSGGGATRSGGSARSACIDKRKARIVKLAACSLKRPARIDKPKDCIAKLPAHTDKPKECIVKLPACSDTPAGVHRQIKGVHCQTAGVQ